MQPNNAIIGDNTGIDLPEMRQEEDQLVEEKKMARYSRSGEYQRLKKHFKERIRYYQRFLPDGRDMSVGQIPTPEQWLVANSIIAEFNLVMDSYDQINEVVKDAESKK